MKQSLNPKRMTFLPVRSGESDNEARLREALNRLCSQALHTLDSALSLRTAPEQAQKTRHLARDGLTEFCSMAMLAFAFAEESHNASGKGESHDR